MPHLTSASYDKGTRILIAERGGSVVWSLDWGSKGCSFKTNHRLSHCVVSLARNFILCLALVQEDKNCPYMTKIIVGWDVMHKNKSFLQSVFTYDIMFFSTNPLIWNYFITTLIILLFFSILPIVIRNIINIMWDAYSNTARLSYIVWYYSSLRNIST